MSVASTVCPCPAAAEKESIKDFSCTVMNTVNSVDEQQWNRHVPEANKLMQFDYLKLIESLQKDAIQFRYVFIKRQDIIVGVAYFQIVRFNAEDLLNYFPEEPAGGVKKYIYRLSKVVSEPVIRSIDLKMLVSGNVFMTGENGFYFNSDIDKQTRAKLLRKSISEITGGDKQIRAVLISDLYEPKSEFDLGFRLHGFHEITVESDMAIRLRDEWKTFDDYVNSMSSKYRLRVKKAIALCNEAGVECKILNQEEIALHENRLFELYEKVMSRAEFKLAKLTKDYFRLQKKQMPGEYNVFAYFREGQIIAFISSFHYNRRMEVHYTGMDQELCKPIHLYQHMMYDMIKFGIEHKVERLHFGRTAPEIKSTIGCVPAPMYGYVKHLNPVFNFIAVRTYTSNLKPASYVMRSPFKE